MGFKPRSIKMSERRARETGSLGPEVHQEVERVSNRENTRALPYINPLEVFSHSLLAFHYQVSYNN